MRILLLGSGGREHAIASKLAESKKCSHLYIAPGNAGTAALGTNIDLNVSDFDAIRQCVINLGIKMVVVGPEVPLVEGIVDYFAADEQLANIAVIGPSKEGAMLEGSKDYAKAFMTEHGIPTARYGTFDRFTINKGIDFLHNLSAPYVLKADGLAAGKGVLILDTLDEAEASLHEMLEKQLFGKASQQVVVEEYLDGIELSVFVLTDGRHYKILPTAKDYKRIGEGDTGPNTGGMGSISPVPFADKNFMQKVEQRIVLPTIRGLRKQKTDYRGFIFLGLMAVKGPDGLDPYVIEYNVRMGDPETQSVFPRIKTDMVDLLEHTWNKTLETIPLDIDSRTAASVVLAAEGYPGSYAKGMPIQGLAECKECMVFHAGTANGNDNKTIVTNGGRVLCVTALSDTLPTALLNCYQAADKITWDGRYMRRDIGQDLLRLSVE
ncbi:MAG: phosphoribosylamine--glycine ligase [Bacteroidales bacterium]|nr:phosphoribosylamine--glycine ligase [Bacteroidales bacterium]